MFHRLIFLGGLLWGSVALARPPEGGSPQAMADKLADHLDLAEADKAKVVEILERSMDDAAPLREKLDGLVDELKAERLAEKLSWPRVEKLVHQIADVKADLMIHKMKTMEEIVGVLPAEKGEQLREFLQRKMEEKRGEEEL